MEQPTAFTLGHLLARSAPDAARREHVAALTLVFQLAASLAPALGIVAVAALALLLLPAVPGTAR